MIIEIADLGKWIRAERQRQGISVAEMAEKAYADIGAIYNVEGDLRKKSLLPRKAVETLDILGYRVRISIIKKRHARGSR